MVNTILKKIDLAAAANLLRQFDPAALDFVRDELESKLKTQMAAFETKPVSLNADVLNAVSAGFVEEQIAKPLARLIRKSALNVAKVAAVFSCVDDQALDSDRKNALGELLIDGLLDNMTKSDAALKDCAAIISAVLRYNAQPEVLPHAEAFLVKLAKKTRSANAESLHVYYCELVSRIGLGFSESGQRELLEQFAASRKAIKSAKDGQKHLTRIIASLKRQNSPALSGLVLGFGVSDAELSCAYSLSLAAEQTSTAAKPDLSVLVAKADKALELTVSMSSFQDFVYPLAVQSLVSPGSLDQTKALRKIVGKDSILAKKHFYASLSYFDSAALLQVINSCADALEALKTSSPAGFHTISIILGLLVESTAAYSVVRLKLHAAVISAAVSGLFCILFEDEKAAGDKTVSQRVIGSLRGQPQFNAIDEGAKVRLCVMLSFTRWTEGPWSPHAAAQVISQLELHRPDTAELRLNAGILNLRRLFRFSHAAANPYAEYFSNVLYLAPSYFDVLAQVFDPNILLRLTRIKRADDLLRTDSGFSVFALVSKDELTALKAFGYAADRDVKHHQTVESLKECSVISDLRALSQAEEHEDEKFEELNNLNSKQQILEAHAGVFNAAAHVLQLFFLKFEDKLQPSHLDALAAFSDVLQASLTRPVYLCGHVKDAFKLVFERLHSRSSSQFKELGEYYYYVLSDAQSSKVFRHIEAFVQKLDTSAPDALTAKLFDILFEIMRYAFRHQFDVEYRKKLFVYLADAAFALGAPVVELYRFICANLNDLFFAEAFAALDSALDRLTPQRADVADMLLERVLDYEDFAQRTVLEKLGSRAAGQIVQPFQKLKLLIVARSEVEDIARAAQELIRANGNLQFAADSFTDLDFGALLLSFPFDMRETISQIFSEMYDNLAAADKRAFLARFAAAFREAVERPKPDKETESRDFEDRLRIFLVVLRRISAKIDNADVAVLFDVVFVIEQRRYEELTKQAIELGVQLIEERPGLAEQLVKGFQAHFTTQRHSLAPLIFIGECAKANSSLAAKFGDMERSVVQLLELQDEAFHRNLARFLRNLIGFFREPEALIKAKVQETMRLKDPLRIRVNCFFVAGLMKGASLKFLLRSGVLESIERLLSESKKRDLKDVDLGARYFCVYFIDSLWLVFGKAIEPCMSRLIDIIMNFLGDNSDDIRHFAKRLIDSFMQSMSEFGIKQIIPTLLRGCNDKNWKTKLNSILALGAVAYCGGKQLSQSLPVIVPKLTSTINDTNEDIKQAAVKSLSLILSTIKNPEISDLRDIIIRSLSDPFNDNVRSLDALLSTSFKHYIDGPALSLVMPIILYGLKSSKTEVGKEKAAKVVASIATLVSSEEDILPHVEPLVEALTSSSKDANADVRAITAKAFKSLSLRFKFLSNMTLNRVKAVLESDKATSIERAGAAQSFAEILSTLDVKTRDGIIADCLELTKDQRDYIKEGFLSLFVYLPIVMGNQYEGLVYKTIESVVDSISLEKEKLRNLAIKSIKILIQNYLKKNIELLIAPFFEGAVSENRTKRNSSLILLGDVADILIEETGSKEEAYRLYPRLFSIFYIMKSDASGEIRLTANNIYKTFVDNTQRCLKVIHSDLVGCLVNLYARESEYHSDIANSGIREFSYKYGDVFARKVLADLAEVKGRAAEREKLGACRMFNQFLAHFNATQLDKERLPLFLGFLLESFDEEAESVYTEVARGFKILSEKTITFEHIRPVVEAQIALVAAAPPSSPQYDKTISLVCELLKSHSQKLVECVNRYIFTGELLEWQLDVILKNSKLYGLLFYSSSGFEHGIKLFFKFLEVS